MLGLGIIAHTGRIVARMMVIVPFGDSRISGEQLFDAKITGQLA